MPGMPAFAVAICGCRATARTARRSRSSAYAKNAPHPPTELHRPGFQHLAFEVDDVDAEASEILARGGRDVGKLVTLDIAGAGKLTLIYMTDPEGNIIELQKWH